MSKCYLVLINIDVDIIVNSAYASVHAEIFQACMYMHVCMCTCKQVSMHWCNSMHAWLHACMAACQNGCVHVSIYACTSPCMHARMGEDLHAYPHGCQCVSFLDCTHATAYPSTKMNAYINRCMHAHAHACTRAWPSVRMHAKQEKHEPKNCA